MNFFLMHNWIAIVVLAILWVLIEGLWYSSNAFGGILKEGKKGSKCGPWCWLVCFILALITTFALSYFDRMTGSHTFGEGALNGFIAWLGFVATTHFQAVYWDKATPAHFSIHAGFKLLAFIIVGGLLAIW